MSATDLVGRLNEFYEIATAAVVKRDGTIDKLMSDHVSAFFGVPYNSEEHARRAVEAALEVVTTMQDRWSGSSPVAAAVGSGAAFVGNVGEARTRDYTAVGSVVNATHDLLAHAQPGETLLSPEAYGEVAAQFPDAAVRSVASPSLGRSVAARSITPGARTASAAVEGTGRRVLVTIVMLDLVGSTAVAAEIGDAPWRDLLARHYQRIRELLARHEGTEIDTAGDGLLATFTTPAQAVRFGQDAIRSAEAIGLRTRIGIHTGEVERDQAAIRGIAVVVAARVGALADAGQILVTSTVRELVAGSGIEFADRGVHTLKGVPEPRPVYEVVRASD